MGRFEWGGRLATIGVLTACSTTATISRHHQPDVEAKIVGGTQRSIIVESGGSRYALPREEVREIDHPGNVHALLGSLLVGYGIVNLVLGLPRCGKRTEFESDAEQYGYCFGVFVPVTLGAGMVLWGAATNGLSKSRANARSSREALPYPGPQMAPTTPGYYYTPPPAQAPPSAPVPAHSAMPAPTLPEGEQPPTRPAPPAPPAPPADRTEPAPATPF